MATRQYDDQDIIALLVASGGRCHICNADVMNDWRTHKTIKSAELAHIKAISDKGPRADQSLSLAERNAIGNLMVLCPTCHSIIDKKIAEGSYTVEWLLRQKEKKSQRIHDILEKLNDEDCLIVKFSSAIDTQNSNFTDHNLFNTCFYNGFFSNDGIINLSEDTNSENIMQSINYLDDKYDKRIQRLIDNGKEKTICLFARAPQPLLMYLGNKFNDKHKIAIFTSHRNLEWKFDDKKKSNTFVLIEPEKKSQTIALVLSVTAKITDARIIDVLGETTEIWRITAEDIGIDKICNQEELRNFYNICVNAIDAIGHRYGKNIEINVFPAVCNSLAITFGRAVFTKSHNKINIYDSVKIDGVIKDVLRLSI